jgi:hypothetical protein
LSLRCSMVPLGSAVAMILFSEAPMSSLLLLPRRCFRRRFPLDKTGEIHEKNTISLQMCSMCCNGNLMITLPHTIAMDLGPLQSLPRVRCGESALICHCVRRFSIAMSTDPTSTLKRTRVRRHGRERERGSLTVGRARLEPRVSARRAPLAVRPLYLQNTSKHWFRNIENHKSHTSQPRSNMQYCIGHRKLFFRSRDYPSTTANQKKHPPPGPQKLQQQMGRTNTGAPCCLRSVKWHHQLRRRKVRLQVLEALVLGVVVLHLRERLRRLLQCRVDLSHAAHVG